MIVKKDDFAAVIKNLIQPGVRSKDTETTGLKWYDKDHLFSLIIADDENSFYFNFNDEPDHLGKRAPEDTILPRKWLQEFEPVFDNKLSKWFAHNAKFDLAMLAKDGLHVTGDVHCTEAVARLINNNFMKYNLEFCVARMCADLKIESLAKSDAVWDYVIKNKLYNEIIVEGKGEPIKEVHYHRVPFEIVAPYGVNDGVIEQKLGRYQEVRVERIVAKFPEFRALVENEKRLTKTALHMAQTGIPFNEPHVKTAMKSEIAKIGQIEKEYIGHTGKEFVDSGVQFAEYFDSVKIPYKRTEKGNPRFDAYAMEAMPNHPVVDLIRSHRDSQKKVSTYYSSFLYYGANGRIHADMRQAGTATGRVSYREPNMQNVPKPDDDDPDSKLVRGCFVPPPDHVLFMPDYDQMEYRMMLDEAEEIGVIKLILGGLDVHEATAQMMGVKRQQAKTINFLLLYGGGAQKLANALGVSLQEAKELKMLYFARLPRVKAWIYKTMKQAEINGYIRNWAGRICYMTRQQAYKAPNYKIQGGCADVVKIAMNNCSELIVREKYNSAMSLQVHDELLFLIHKNELDLQPKIVKAMEDVYKCKHLPLTAGPGHSWTTWGEKVDGFAV